MKSIVPAQQPTYLGGTAVKLCRSPDSTPRAKKPAPLLPLPLPNSSHSQDLAEK